MSRRWKRLNSSADNKSITVLLKHQFEEICGAKLALKFVAEDAPEKQGRVPPPDTEEGRMLILERFKERMKRDQESEGRLDDPKFLSRENLDYITAINRISLMGAFQCAKNIALDGKESASSGIISAESAKTFLDLFDQLVRTQAFGPRDDAMEAAMYLGICAMMFYATETGKTLSQIATAHQGRSKGGRKTRLVGTSEEQAKMMEVWNKYKGGDKPLFKTAKELYDLGIKGRGGKAAISERRLKEKLKAAGVKFPKKGQR